MAALLLAVTACAPTGAAPVWTYAPAAASPLLAGDAGGAEPTPTPTPSPSAPSSPTLTPPADTSIDPGDDGDEGMKLPTVSLNVRSPGVQVYATSPSILAGETLELHASTTARSYSLEVAREGSPRVVVFRRAGYAGRDYRSRVTKALPPANTVRANWPVTAAIATGQWRPGVYTAVARDSSRRVGATVFVVRDAAPDPAKGLFVLPVMDYQAYDAWGGADFYTQPISARAMTISFDRPYAINDGLGHYAVYDRSILAWLERHHYELAYTTDYDLAVHPPTSAPRVLVLPQHTEYVNRALFDWVDTHVNVRGDMSVALFGANSFYWQVRLEPDPVAADHPDQMTCYKLQRLDPMATSTTPWLTTVRWVEPPVSRSEAALFGARYAGIVDGGHVPVDMRVTAAAPAWLLDGTGWTSGTTIRGVLSGEADATDASRGGVAVLQGTSVYHARLQDVPLTAQSTLWVSPAGARVFDAGTFGWGGALAGRWPLGVSVASFSRFNANILAWLGLPVSPDAAAASPRHRVA